MNDSNTNEKTGVVNSETQEEKGGKFGKTMKEKIINIGIVATSVFFIVYFISPTVLILLGQFISAIKVDAALEQLNNNVNSAVGIVGLVLAIFSIYYAFVTNKSMDDQQQRNEVFLHQIDNKIENIKQDILSVISSNEVLNQKVDGVNKNVETVSKNVQNVNKRVKNLSGELPQSEDDANEEL